MALLPPVTADPFFLAADPGERFCLYYPPLPGTKCRGVFIYVHPFCDEMNKSRRMAAIQARTFSAMGFGVLQIDLFGCGDSSGDFRDARWEIWKQDLAAAKDWLEKTVCAPVGLWGLRLGALLALDFARSSRSRIDLLILWQPVLSGESFLTQFLRLRLANEIFAADAGAQAMTGTNTMRGFLQAGNTLEVAGYELSPELAASIDSLRVAELAMTGIPVHWFEIVASADRSITPAGAKVVNAWKQESVDLHVHTVVCSPFWATQEISECADLVSSTAAIFAEMAQ